jgi:hypothetical protein
MSVGVTPDVNEAQLNPQSYRCGYISNERLGVRDGITPGLEGAVRGVIRAPSPQEVALSERYP